MKSIFQIEDIQAVQGTGVEYKNAVLKKQLLEILAKQGNSTINDLSNSLLVSTPKVNDLLSELMKLGIVKDFGKIAAGVGRKPNLFGLEPSSANFIGVEVRADSVNIGMMDFSENFTHFEENVPYRLRNSEEALKELAGIIENFIKRTKVPKSKVIGVGVNLSGRVNHSTGYSYSYFNFGEIPVSLILQQMLNIEVFIENDSRAMAYGEFYCHFSGRQKNVLFVNMDYGIGLGLIIDGKLYHGKSGYAGEFGHVPLLENDILCHCGKKGCLETEVSGRAITEKFKRKLASGADSIVLNSVKNTDLISFQDIIEATLKDDMLAIETISEAGEKLGRGIALLINLFNPELIILGGSLAKVDSYIRLPVQYAINKYSLNLISSDAEITTSVLGKRAGIIGACLIARNKTLMIDVG